MASLTAAVIAFFYHRRNQQQPGQIPENGVTDNGQPNIPEEQEPQEEVSSSGSEEEN